MPELRKITRYAPSFLVWQALCLLGVTKIIMIDSTLAAYIFTGLTIVVVIFQLALASGVPWGEMAMGGKFPGRFPLKMRVAALVQMALLVFMALVILSHVGLVFEQYSVLSKSAVWFVVVVCAVSAILNTITPSKKERMLWAPVAILLFFCSFVVAWS